MSRGVFLDLNGTLIRPLKPERLDELTLIPGVVQAIARLTAKGFVCPVVTVQSRTAKGLFSSADFDAWFARFAADLVGHGARVVGPYVCPHRFAEPCSCKKPSTLLYERAALEHGIDATQSFVIGDSPDDVRAARRLGARGCLVRTGWASDPRVVEAAAPDATVIWRRQMPQSSRRTPRAARIDEFRLKEILVRGSQAWKVADLLKSKNLPVLLSVLAFQRATVIPMMPSSARHRCCSTKAPGSRVNSPDLRRMFHERRHLHASRQL